MSANVERLFFTGETPWHGEGNLISDDDIFDIEKGIDSAGLNWEVETVGLTTVDGQPVTSKGVRRMSDQKILGVVGPRWTPVQNRDMFKWFQPFLDARECSLHTAGSLCGGSKVWVLCQIANDPLMKIADNDDVCKFILLANSHDGTLAVRAGFTCVRIVCTNTLSAAIRSANSKLIRIRHSSKVAENMELVKDVINLANRDFEATAEQYRKLASTSINATDLRNYVKIVLDLEPEDSKMSTRSKNILADVMNMVVSGRGQDNPAIAGTYWQAYNGVNEYLNYSKGRNNSNRIESLWFGMNAGINQKAFETAMKMAG